MLAVIVALPLGVSVEDGEKETVGDALGLASAYK